MKDEFWERYLEYERSKARRITRSIPPLSGVLSHGETREEADCYLQNIISGKVSASICTLDTWNDSGRDIPAARSLFMMMDGSGIPRCILRTASTHIVPYRKLPEELALREGQDNTLAEWQARWRPILFEESRRRGKTFSLDLLMMVHVFTVAYYEKDEDFISPA